MSWDNNPYYDPKAFGLELVGSIDWDLESYQFNMTVVWKESRGKYYLADDSGCSCPSPFEGTAKEDLDGPMDKRSLEAALRYRAKTQAKEDGYYGRPRAELEKEVRELLAKLR
jgi:hypothetical protein